MTCVLIKLATRWRTLASDIPSSAANFVNGRRPSNCSVSMMRWSISSIEFLLLFWSIARLQYHLAHQYATRLKTFLLMSYYLIVESHDKKGHHLCHQQAGLDSFSMSVT